jgi:hypothetical protein
MAESAVLDDVGGDGIGRVLVSVYLRAAALTLIEPSALQPEFVSASSSNFS